LAYNFTNNDSEILTMEPPTSANDVATTAVPEPAPAGSATPAAPATSPATQPQSVHFVRFRSCRWHQPAENGNQEFCTHREVKPYAGTTGFDADAWCGDCQFYKLRRSPKKRPANTGHHDDYSY
jgi:hypothetical protein